MSETARPEEAGAHSDGVAPAVGTGLAALSAAAMGVPVRRGVADPVVATAAIFALAAVLAFLGRRYDLLDRRIAAPIAAASSLAVVLLSGYAMNQGVMVPATLPVIDWSISLVLTAFFTAGIATGVAVGDYYRIGGRGLFARTLKTTLLLVVGLAGLVAAQVATIVLALPAFAVTDSLSQIQLIALSQFGMAVGTASVAVLFLAMWDHDRSFIDLEVPTLRDLGWTVGGLVVLFGAIYGISVLFQSTGVESADHGTAEMAAENPELMLVMVPASILIIGPFEELLYRNVIQKSLYDVFSRGGAVVVGSVIFAVVHVFAYGTASPGEVLASLGVVFGLSIVLGVIYERTGNLFVPAVVHGVYNAIIFANLYLTYA